MLVRLQKFLADAGIASRRASEKVITAGRVCVNGQVVEELGSKVDPAHDRVTVADLAARCVDEECARLHLVQPIRVDHAPRLGC